MSVAGPDIKNMRFFLRSETRTDHEQTDAAFSQFDFGSANSYSNFLKSHARALSVLLPLIAEFDVNQMLVENLTNNLRQDLASLGFCGLYPSGFEVKSAHPAGVAYVLAGSHLGSKVLLQRIEAGCNPVCQSAVAYLSNTELVQLWHRLLNDFDAGRWSDERDEVLDGARTAFRVFRTAGQEL